ncbi:YceI family protein [Tenacibaculum sp. nBUS_03]|uniref:YceI family protein n=1 Tax=Tenacibaculum sp. nBUS_03 TaxID=3395320 RepID=UPI003EBEDAF9
MKNKILMIIALGAIVVFSGYTNRESERKKNESSKVFEGNFMNLFVTHGHCSTPFSSTVNNLEILLFKRKNQGNPLENMKLSFALDPESFKVCSKEVDVNKTIKKPGVFINEKKEQITFTSTDVFTMGIDWYQVNGIMSIRGVEREVKLFVSGIRSTTEIYPSFLILEGRVNLFDWGIDYDKVVTGISSTTSTKWMHFNMKIRVS